MKRRYALHGIAAFLISAARAAPVAAQAGDKVVVIGCLDAGERLEWWEAFRRQMRELGYVEGRNLRFEARYAKGELDALPAFAKALVRAKVAIIVTAGAAAAVAAQRASTSIPIVMASGADQVSMGLAESLARPGGNVTGVSSLNSDLMVKRFQLLRELVPKVSRLGVLWHADNPASMTSVRDLEGAAGRAHVAFHSFGVRKADQIPDLFAAMKEGRIDAIVVVNSPLIYNERRRIADLALKHKLPGMYGAAEYVDAGGLMSYAASYPDMFRHAALYVDKILRGAKPGELPIEQPTTFELVINANTARALDVAVPPGMMALVNRVVQ